MKSIGTQYYCQNQDAMYSYRDTLNDIQNIHKNFKKNISGELNNSQKSITKQFDYLIGNVTDANDKLQLVKNVCEYPSKMTSWMFGRSGKDCFGYNIPDLDPNRILNQNLGKMMSKVL